MNEKQWQALVVELAVLYGWLHYHTHDSRRSTPGFPDLVLVRGTEMLFAELKTDSGRLSSAQTTWLTSLSVAGQEVQVWRPADLPAVHDRLRRSGAGTSLKSGVRIAA